MSGPQIRLCGVVLGSVQVRRPTKSIMISIEPNRRPSRCSLSGFCFLIWYSLNDSDCHLPRMTKDPVVNIVSHSYSAEGAVQPSLLAQIEANESFLVLPFMFSQHQTNNFATALHGALSM
jgi:hypothetical protein